MCFFSNFSLKVPQNALRQRQFFQNFLQGVDIHACQCRLKLPAGDRCELVAESPCWRSVDCRVYTIDQRLVSNHKLPAELTIRP